MKPSICPFNSRICRGPECALLAYQDQADGGYLYYCGASHALPDDVYAVPIVSPEEARRTAASAANTDGGKEKAPHDR